MNNANNKNDNFRNLPPKVSDFPNTEISGKKEGSLQSYVFVAAVCLLAGFFVGAIFTSRNANNKADSDQTRGASDIFATTSLSGADTIGRTLSAADVLSVSDQKSGFEVEIKKMNFPKTVWVAIHEDNGSGEPGNILGAQLFNPDMKFGKVELLRGTENGGTYYAVIRDDNGDRAFIPKMDIPIVGADGKSLLVIFRATNE